MLPISMTIALHTSASLCSSVRTRSINWARAVENGDVHGFAEQVSTLTSPFVHATHQSIHELQWEITYITKAIIDAATRCLPHKKAKKKRSFVKDDQLKDLCKTSKAVWKKWSDAGRRSYGPLAEEIKLTKRNVRHFVAIARARHERSTIQERDRLFKETHPLRFKTSSLRTECTKLVIDGQSVTDTSGILNTFRSFFGSLAQSDLPLSSEQCAALSEMEASSFGNNEQILDTDIFNRLLTLEELPDCLKVGLVVPIYKRQGKDPLLVSSYRGITLSSVLSKVLEIILLQRLSSPLEKQGFPDQLQTAYQKGVSCMDAIFATQETLTNHL